jgi:DNA-binding Lrp family transcriptional regulator
MFQNIGRIDESLRLNPARLDLKDKQIITNLTENSRIPFTQLKKIIRISRDSVNYRVEGLKRKNILMAFFPTINLKRFGFFTFHTFLVLDEKNPKKTEEFLEYLKKQPFVKNVIEYSDIWDLEIVTVAKNVWEYDEKFNQITSKFHDIIQEKEKVQVIKGYNSIHLPYHFYAQSNYNFSRDIKKSADVDVDGTDLEILEILCIDGRQQYHEIAKKIGLTPEAISYRIRKMCTSNVIRKFTAQVNLSSLGYHWFTLMIQTKTFNTSWDLKMKRFVNSHPYIIRAVKTLGRWDFMFYVVADNPRQFHNTAKEIKREFSEIIKNHDTLLAYKEHFFTVLPECIIDDSRDGSNFSDEFYKDIVD